jgi:hypothetical protein
VTLGPRANELASVLANLMEANGFRLFTYSTFDVPSV